MVSKIENKDFAPVAEFVNEVYGGNLLLLTKWLDRAVYMFHYLPEEEDFSANEKRNAAYALMCLKERIMQAYFKQRGLEYVPMD